MEHQTVISSEALLDTAFDVVRRVKDHDAYGSVAKACRALHRRCPEFSAEQCAEAFQQAEHLFNVAMEVVEKIKNCSWQIGIASMTSITQR